MAFFTNNKNMSACGFIKNNEISLLNSISSDSDLNDDLIKIKCIPPELRGTTEAGDNPGKQTNKQSFITSAAISNCCNVLVAADSFNFIYFWKREMKAWNILSSRPLVRKCHKVIFSNSGTEAILADRSGEVFSFSVSNCTEAGKFLLGHICLILDIAISSEDKYLATCDRDGKIRVSCYPNCYNIMNYCLGHQEFVSSIQFIRLANEFIVSSSGDGTVCIWHPLMDGSRRTCVSLHESDYLSKQCNVSDADETALFDSVMLNERQIQFSVRGVRYNTKHCLLAVIFHLQSGLVIYEFSEDQVPRLEMKQFISVATPPLDAAFSSEDGLFVLLNQDVDALLYFEYNIVKKIFIISDKIIQPKVLELQKFYKNCQDSMHFSEDFVSLFKRVYENSNDDRTTAKKNKVE